MHSVFIYKTNVSSGRQVKSLVSELNRLVNPGGSWNFDLEDCDNILRVETRSSRAEAIPRVLRSKGFDCEELLD